jgi:hypothetical protein
VSNKEGMFFEEGGHDSREFCEFLAEIFFCYGRSYCMDPYSPYDYVQSVQSYRFGIEIEVIFDTVFKAIFRFLVVVFGHTIQSV